VVKDDQKIKPKVNDIKVVQAAVSKTKSASQKEEVKDHEEVPIKRKRGRPRKNPLMTPVESHMKNPVKKIKQLRFKNLVDPDVLEAVRELVGIVSDDSGYPVTPYPGKAPSNERILRPPNAFMIYGKENRKALAQRNPGKSNKEISILLGIEWKGLPEEVKQPYRLRAKKNLESHKRQFPSYTYCPNEARKRKSGIKGGRLSFGSSKKKTGEGICRYCRGHVLELEDERETNEEMENNPSLKKFKEENKENINTEDIIGKRVTAISAAVPKSLPLRREPLKVITDLFVAPPGYEDVEIKGLDKFVLVNKKLIPYEDWIQAEGDVKRLSGKNYTDVPDDLLKPVVEYSVNPIQAINDQEKEARCSVESTSGLFNTAFYQDHHDMTLSEYNGIVSSEADKMTFYSEDKTGSEMDVRTLLHDLMGGGQGRMLADSSSLAVRTQPQLDSKGKTQDMWGREVVQID
jgi:hypothetical protein